MKRFLAAAAVAAGLAAALAGCGVAQSPATAAGAASGSPSAAGTSSGRPGHVAPSPRPPAGKRWLPVVTARQVRADHLLPQNWKLLRVAPGGTAVEISYFFGPCLGDPAGVLVSESGGAVTLSLEAPSPSVAGDCAPVVATRAAWVRIPALDGRALRPGSSPQ
jgi:hypothetical protein